MEPCQETRLFAKDESAWVYIHHIDNDGFLWVMLMTEVGVMESVSRILNSEDHIPLNDPAADNIVCALHVSDNTWYRARIISTGPTCTVHFIDYGDTLDLPRENLAPLPDILSGIHPLAMKVKLPSLTEAEPSVGSTLLLQYIDCVNGEVTVDVILPDSDGSLPLLVEISDQSQTQQFPQVDPEQHSCTPSNISQSISETFLISQPKEENVTCEFKEFSHPDNENVIHVEGSTSVMLCENQAANVISNTAENDASCSGQKCIPETAPKEELTMVGDSQTSVDPCVIPDSDEAMSQTEELRLTSNEIPLNSEKECNLAAHSSCNQSVSNKLSVLLSVLQKNEEESCAAVDLGNVSAFPPNSSSLNTQEGYEQIISPHKSEDLSLPEDENLMHVEGSTSVMLCENQAANAKSITAENDASCFGQKCIPETVLKDEPTIVCDSQTSDSCVIPDSDEALSQTEELRLTSNEIPLNSEKDCNLAHSSFNQSVSNKLSVLQTNEEESCAAVDLVNASAFPPNSSSLNTQEGYEQIISPHKSEDLSLPEDENLMHIEGSTSVMLCENQAANVKSNTAENGASCSGQKCIPETVLKEEATMAGESQTSVDPCVIPDSDEALSQTEELRLTSNEIPLNSEKDCNLAHSSFNQSVSNKLSVLQTNEEESCAAVDLVYLSAFPPNSSSLNTQEGYEQIISPHKSEDLSLPEDENLMHIEGSTSVMLCENQPANVKSITAENDTSCFGQKCIPETALKEEAIMAGESQTSVDPFVIPDSDYAVCQTEQVDAMCSEKPGSEDHYAPVGVEPLTLVECAPALSNLNQAGSDELPSLPNDDDSCCKSEEMPNTLNEDLIYTEESTFALCENRTINEKLITAENDGLFAEESSIPVTFDGDQVKTEVSSPSLACVDHSAHFAVDPCEILQCCEAVGKTEGLYLTNSENLQDTVNFNHTLSSTEQPARDKLLIQQAASTKEEVLLSGKDCSASLIDLDQPVPKERSANSQNSQHDTLIDKDMPKDIKDEKAEIDHIKDSSSGQSPVNHLAVKSTSFSVDQHSSAEGVNISSYIPEDLSQVLRNDKFNCPQKPRIISKRHTAESSCQDESRAPNYMQAASCSETTMPTNVGSSSSQEFETILEFELDILREQHRLQMFALQKRMEKHAEYQINAFRVEMSRQFDSLFNELNNRIQFINDSVVHKMANLYSEITMLKNEQEVTKINNPAELDSQFGNNFNLNSSQNKMPINIHNQNPSFENNTVNQPRMKSNPVELDSQFGNNCNLNSSQNKMPINPHNQNPTFENYTVSQPRMKSRGRITERPNCDQSSTEMMDHHSNLGLNSDQYNSSKYPKMDHFESKPELKVEKIEKRQQQSKVILVSNLNDVEVKIDHLFNLFGLYGNICVIKIEKGKAFVEMADANQAAEVIRNLNNVPLRGKQLRLYPSKWEKINITREDLQANTCKDFKKTAMKNLQRPKFNSFPPSKTLKIYNLSNTVSDDKIHELFAKEGFNIRRLNIVSMNNSEKKLAYVSFDSIEEAVNALTVMHLQETDDWVKMKIVFSRN